MSLLIIYITDRVNQHTEKPLECGKIQADGKQEFQ